MRGFASLPELAKALDVSESTVRRDVENLEEQGSASRIHGGVLYAGTSPKLASFRLQATGAVGAETGDCPACFDVGRGRRYRALGRGEHNGPVGAAPGGRPVHVVTNSVPVANLFVSDTASDLVLIGGNICPRTGVAQGPLADQMIATLRVRKTILSVATINDEGFFNNNLLLVETERAMMKAADETIVVADSSKFGHRALANLCGWTPYSASWWMRGSAARGANGWPRRA